MLIMNKRSYNGSRSERSLASHQKEYKIKKRRRRDGSTSQTISYRDVISVFFIVVIMCIAVYVALKVV